jgi:hypothetical protein
VNVAAQVRTESVSLSERPGRRGVELRAFLVRSNEEIVDLKVLDLSYDGCGIETETHLNPGEQVKMSVLGRGSVRASVRWFKGRKGGLLFLSEPAAKKHWPRRSDRQPVSVSAHLRRAGKQAYATNASDLSPHGCKCEFVDRPEIAERMWLKFDGLQRLECEVSWVDGSSVGLQFARPVHHAVFEMLLHRLTESAAQRA